MAATRLLTFYRARYPGLQPSALRERFLSDAVYGVPARRTALAHAQVGGAAFLYRFDWSPPGAGAVLGASHGFDEAFVWNAAAAEHFPLTAGDESAQGLGQAMSPALIAFAETDAPNWPAVSSGMRLFGAGDVAWAAIDADLLVAWDGVERR